MKLKIGYLVRECLEDGDIKLVPERDYNYEFYRYGYEVIRIAYFEVENDN